MKLIQKHQEVTCNEGWQWIVTDSNACIGRISHDKKVINPIHGYWGDVRLKYLAEELQYTYKESGE